MRMTIFHAFLSLIGNFSFFLFACKLALGFSALHASLTSPRNYTLKFARLPKIKPLANLRYRREFFFNFIVIRSLLRPKVFFVPLTCHSFIYGIIFSSLCIFCKFYITDFCTQLFCENY